MLDDEKMPAGMPENETAPSEVPAKEPEPAQASESAEQAESAESTESVEPADGEPAVAEPEKTQDPTARIRNLYDWLEVVSAAAVIVLLIFMFIGRMATVSGTSMTNTLQNGDRLIVGTLFYKPDRYDIVVVQKKEGYYKDELLVKRVIAMGGETITFDFENWKVTVDGVTLAEPYVRRVLGYMERESLVSDTVTVPEGYYFVMGDNRNGSTDSRSSLVGFVAEREIVGQAVYRVFPFSAFGSIGF